jgi:small-conductance mechanosensitive channel
MLSYDAFNGVFDSVEEILETSTLAGQISPLIQKFLLSKAQRQAIWSGIRHVAKFSDICFLVVLGWALVPTLTLPYERWMSSPNTPHFRSTKTYHVADSLSQVAKLAMLVYVVDMIKIFLLGAGFGIPRGERLTHAFSYIVYTIWATSRLSDFKKYLLYEMTKESEGRLQVFNRLVDSLLFLCALFLILDILKLEMGLAVRGVFAFGSVGTLIFSLASKDIAANWLYGIILSASDRIYEGDSVQLHKSGFSGTVARLGWLETVFRGSDEVMITLPNSQLLSEQVCNLSRIHQSQVKQTLRFPFSDSEKLPQLLQDIKTEIRSHCPSVITDGSRPFRCYWTDYADDHLEVVVDSHFRVKPVGDAYHENRQRVLLAIDQAVKKNNMEFHTPS